jgi:hypothetical protein
MISRTCEGIVSKDLGSHYKGGALEGLGEDEDCETGTFVVADFKELARVRLDARCVATRRRSQHVA